MASALVSSYSLIQHQISLYYGIPVLAMGILGGSLNIIVFVSFRTFRQSSCAFYLMSMSIFDLGQLSITILSFVIRWAFDINWIIQSVIFCKTRAFMSTICTLSSRTCLCLAIVDQYFATCTRPRWQQWCNMKLAYRLSAFFIILWMCHGIPYLIFFKHIILPTTTQLNCQVTNSIFIQYNTYGYFLVLNNLIPFLTFIFGVLAYDNVRTIPHRTIPLVRRELEKQLTVMVLVQILINFLTSFPYSIQTMLALTIVDQANLPFRTTMNFISNLTLFLYTLNCSSSFYTYMAVSTRFRRQLKYVLYDIHLNRCRQNLIAPIPDVLQ